jgi:hypothetical protein
MLQHIHPLYQKYEHFPILLLVMFAERIEAPHDVFYIHLVDIYNYIINKFLKYLLIVIICNRKPV